MRSPRPCIIPAAIGCGFFCQGNSILPLAESMNCMKPCSAPRLNHASWLRFPFWLLHILIVVNHNCRVLWYPSLADERNIRLRFCPCHFMFGTHKSPCKTGINTHAPIYYRTISQSLNQVSLILKLEIPSLITIDINYMGLLWEKYGITINNENNVISLLYHIRQYFVGTFTYIGLKNRHYI